MTGAEQVLASLVLISAAILVAFVLAIGIDRAYEREVRRLKPRPRIPEAERRLLGDDWRDVVRRRGQ